MIEAVVSEHVNAPADRVRALYRDPDNWARLFPATIRGARVVRREGDTTVVEVDHVEGKVVNILRDSSSTRTDLVEFKRRYDATFVNEFIPEGEGMRYTLTASVRLKWPYRVAAPFVKPLVLSRMRRYVVEPLKAAERDVLELDKQLPSSWSNYNLIVSTSMLEYVARPDLSQALSVLGARLARHGTFLVVNYAEELDYKGSDRMVVASSTLFARGASRSFCNCGFHTW